MPSPDRSARATGRRPLVLEGEIPSPLDPPSGCAFRTRSWQAQARCAVERPLLEAQAHGVNGAAAHRAACHFPLEEVRSGSETS